MDKAQELERVIIDYTKNYKDVIRELEKIRMLKLDRFSIVDITHEEVTGFKLHNFVEENVRECIVNIQMKEIQAQECFRQLHELLYPNVELTKKG